MKSLKTYKNFSAGYAAKSKVPAGKGQLVYEKLSKKQQVILRHSLKKAKALQLQ